MEGRDLGMGGEELQGVNEGRHMKRVIRVLVVLTILVGCASHLANLSWDLKPAGRPGYGYTAEDPICTGFSGNLQRNIELSETYLASLRTMDLQPFQVVFRVATKDPKHEAEYPKVLGLAVHTESPRGGILDCYELVSASERDTVRLYFDIYHRDSLRVPSGLLFVPPKPKE